MALPLTVGIPIPVVTDEKPHWVKVKNPNAARGRGGLDALMFRWPNLPQ
jgi:hypothetical protein